jgi:hypothetical protein
LPNSKPKPNALSHGLYSDCIVLDGEKPEEFEDLLDALRDEYSPLGVSEDEAVFDLAGLFWKRRRLEANLQQALNMRRGSTVADAAGGGWVRIADEARAMATSQLEAAQIPCEKILKAMAQVVSKTDEAIDDKEAAEIAKLTVLTQQLNVISKELVIPIIHIAEKEKHDQIERAYNPDIMERELKIQAELDRRIDKALKRLIMIKEYKKFHTAKTLDPIRIGAPTPKSIGEETDIEVDASVVT